MLSIPLAIIPFIAGVIAFLIWASQIEQPLPIGIMVLVSGGALLFIVLSFLAFDRVRVERDKARNENKEANNDVATGAQELKKFKVVADGMGVDAATILKALWDKFSSGISQQVVEGEISSQFAGGSNSASVLKAANSITNHLCLYMIIQSEQRPVYHPQGTYEETCWKLTDFGKEVVQYLQKANQ